MIILSMGCNLKKRCRYAYTFRRGCRYDYSVVGSNLRKRGHV